MQDTRKNKLYFGDNLDVLRKHIKDESVDLVYIDPPFNSKRSYNQIYNNFSQDDMAQAQAFTDTWEWDNTAWSGLRQILENESGRFTPQIIELIKGLHNVLRESSLLAYVISMTLRIVEIHRVLKPKGTFYLHCDPTSSHYLKLILDGIFCAQGGDFQNELIWKRTSAHNDTAQGIKRFGRNHDVIFLYTKTDNPIWNPQYTQYEEEYIRKTYNNVDPDGRRWKSSDLTGPGGAAKGNPQYEFLGVTRYWRYSKQNMEKLLAEGRIYQSRPGAVPRMKHYLDEMPGVPLQDLWTDIKPVAAQAAERLGYPTQKPEALLERIIKSSSNEGDTILDAYCGCGTTVAVAQRLNRQWIGIDITYQSISLILKRLEDTFGEDALRAVTLDGIPRDMESATALAHKKDDRVRKEFEKWAILTYSNNRATINEKKGADRGIDGIAYFMASKTDNDKIIFQVKSGSVGEKDIRDLRGTMEQERAPIGIFITLQKPTAPMTKAARIAGTYHHALMDKDYDKIQIVTIKDIIEKGKKLEMPLTHDPLKSAKPHIKEVQLELGVNF